MARTEVNWNRETPEGEKVQAYAHLVGKRWIFHIRGGRFDDWKENPDPPLEDWLELLDGVRRRIGRRLARPEDETLVVSEIRKLFPKAEIPPKR